MSMRGWEGDDNDAAFMARRATNSGAANENDRDGPPAGDDATNDTTQKAPTTTKRKRNMLADSHLLSQEGLKKIYQTFPYQTNSNVAGQEAKALSSLIKMYKQWAYDLYPGLNFDDFVDRTEALGKTHAVQGLMSDLRSKEMRRALGLPEDDSHLPEEQGRSAHEDGEQREDDPDASGFIVPGGDDFGDEDDNYGEEEAML